MKIVVDSREKKPYSFREWQFQNVVIVRKKLDYGDYSLLGHEATVFVERKSIDDLVNTLVSNKIRFKKELKRAEQAKHKLVLVDGSMSEIMSEKYHSTVNREYLITKIAELSTVYNLRVIFSGNRFNSKLYLYTYFQTLIARGYCE